MVTALQLLQEIGSLMALFWIAFNELRLFGIDRVHAQRAMSEFLVVLPFTKKPCTLVDWSMKWRQRKGKSRRRRS